MRRKPVKVQIRDFTGTDQEWQIGFKQLPPRHDGICDYDTRSIWINYRLRNQLTILLTLLHEVAHATLGPNLGETAVLTIDTNFGIAVEAIAKANLIRKRK